MSGKWIPGTTASLLLLLLASEPLCAQLSVGRYTTLELIFTASESPANPFDTYLLVLEVTDPSGTTRRVEGFFDGDGQGGAAGTIWKARICPDATGTWRWRTVPGDAPDAALEGLQGEFNCVTSGERGGVVNQGESFHFQTGDPVYLVGNFLDFTVGTTHTYMSEMLTDAKRDSIIARQRDFHRANKMNVYFANRGDYGGVAVTPWPGTASSNDKNRMDLARWRKYDSYILRFKESRMLAEMWFFADDSDFGFLSDSVKNRLFRYAMARTSAYNHVLFVIALEWGEGWTRDAVTRAGNYIQDHNPWGRLVSVHNHTDWAFSGQSWATFIATQAGNGAYADTVNRLAVTMRTNESIPHIDEEFGILNSDSDTRLMRNLWANFCGGAAGSGTGSGLKALQRFLELSRVPFHRMVARNDLVSGGGTSRFCLAEPGSGYVVYSPSGSFTLNVAASSGGSYTGRWFNPRDPNASLGSGFAVGPGTLTFNPPDLTADWVLWITDGRNLTNGVTHPTTGVAVVRHVVEQSSNSPPAVGLTAPANGATFVVGDQIQLEAVAQDTDGTVARVSFFVDGSLLGADTTAPYGVTWDTTGEQPGTPQLRAEATDDRGTTTVSQTVTISLNASPDAPKITRFSVDPVMVVRGTTATYTLIATDSTAGTLTYSIDAGGDGVPERTGTMAAGATVTYTHQFLKSGDWTSVATVVDAAGLEAVATTEVSVVEPLGSASTGATPQTGAAPLSVIFSGSATGGVPPFSFAWDFGDGTTDPGPGNDVSHTYSTPDTYLARVTVRDSTGATAVGETEISVSGTPSFAPSDLQANALESGAVMLTWVDNSGGTARIEVERWEQGAQNLTVVVAEYRSNNTPPTVETAGTVNSFKPGSRQVNDRDATWSEVAPSLEGAMRLLCARDDKGNTYYDTMYTVSLSTPATVYAVVSPQHGTNPMPFMDASWVLTPLTATSVGSGAGTFHIWRKAADAGSLTLGTDPDWSMQGACYVFLPRSSVTVVASLPAGATEVTDATVQPATSYTYRIKAVDASGNEAFSNVVTVEVAAAPDDVAPRAPTNLQVRW